MNVEPVACGCHRWASHFLAFCLMLAGSFATAQGFAGLGTEADGFSTPQRGTALAFPADHGPHPDYRIEWWYLTANLKGEDGLDYGVQWTLFRSAISPGEADGWASPQVWMGHAGLTTPTEHFVGERLARGGTGQAGVIADPFSAWIDDWSAVQSASSSDPLDNLTVTAAGDGFSYELNLEAEGPLVLQGDQGYSVKSPAGQASYYYSQPFYRISGQLELPGKTVAVNGNGWLDREWSSQPLSESQDGWDWISLHFDTGEKLMGFRLRDREGQPFTSATWIGADGSAVPYGDGALTLTPTGTADVNGADIPVEWRVEFPERDLSVSLGALNPQSWMATQFPYWEGPVTFSGTHTGRGYLEMTGYR